MNINPTSSATILPTIMTSHSQLGNASTTSNDLSSLSDSSSSLVQSKSIRERVFLPRLACNTFLPDFRSETTQFRWRDYWLWTHQLTGNPILWSLSSCPLPCLLLPVVPFLLPVVFLAQRICSFFDEKISRYRARNLNAEDKKLIELRIQFRGGTSSVREGKATELLQVFYSLNSTTQEELRVKVFNKARAANLEFFLSNELYDGMHYLDEYQLARVPSELQWIFGIYKRNSNGQVSCVNYLFDTCFWDGVDDLIEEKISNSSL